MHLDALIMLKIFENVGIEKQAFQTKLFATFTFIYPIPPPVSLEIIWRKCNLDVDCLFNWLFF